MGKIFRTNSYYISYNVMLLHLHNIFLLAVKKKFYAEKHLEIVTREIKRKFNNTLKKNLEKRLTGSIFPYL